MRALVACTLAAAGCQLFVDLDGLEDMSCPPGYKACNGQCVSESDTATGCGDPGCNPCAPKHAKAICDQKNHCSFTAASCIAPWADCDGAEDTGCETDTDHTPKYCGGCDKEPCPDPPNAIAGCSGGDCAILKCVAGWFDLDGEVPNGCEHPIGAPVECASCGVSCPEDQSGTEGICPSPVGDAGAD
jgi:hypothetical protein